MAPSASTKVVGWPGLGFALVAVGQAEARHFG
jgi:hypothetical protein